MRDRDRELWSVGGTFLSHSEAPLTGLQTMSIQKLDALIISPDGKQCTDDDASEDSSIKFRKGPEFMHGKCCRYLISAAPINRKAADLFNEVGSKLQGSGGGDRTEKCAGPVTRYRRVPLTTPALPPMMTGSDLAMRGFPDDDDEGGGVGVEHRAATCERSAEPDLDFFAGIVAEAAEKAMEASETPRMRVRKQPRPRLHRSFSCDYDGYSRSDPYDTDFLVTCDVAGCECDNAKSPRSCVQAFNLHCSYPKIDEIKLRRNSVQFSDTTESPMDDPKRTHRRNSVQFVEEEILIDPSDNDDELENQSSDEYIDADDCFAKDTDRPRRDSLYSLQEEDLDENENLTKAKKPDDKKKSGFLRMFSGKKQKSIDVEEESALKKSRKYSSTSDISSKTLKRSSSFLKKKLNNFLGHETGAFLKRSLSFRSLNDKREEEKSKEKLLEMKNQQWAQSLQSLVENDQSVSYKDMSFVNYDVLDKCNYSEDDGGARSHNKGKIWRSQSMLVNGSFEARTSPKLQRGTSLAGDAFVVSDRIDLLSIDIAEQSAVSLPSLHHLNQENADVSPDSSTAPRYQRRQQSISSEDGRQRPCTNGSFRSAGSGCAKLKRHNACRQKSRTVGSLPVKPFQDVSVRSRSLNHLDTLDMRQGVPAPADPSLKDARSEPDCTKPLLAPPVNAPPCDTVSPTRPTPPARRHVLSRSQKSSSECFSVNFEVGDESIYDTELFFPAARGVTLHDALSKQCELRSIDLSNCDAWLFDKEGNSQSWLPLSQDTACLVGKHVRITNRDAASRNKLGTPSLGGHARKLSGNFRPKTGGFFSSSTEDATALTANWPQDPKATSEFDYKKQTKQRWSGLFGNNKDAKLLMEQLIEQLGNYSKFGVPGLPSYPIGQSEATDTLYKLEDDWRDIINASELTEKQQKQQTALWELIKTEVAYIKTLKVVTDLFLACLHDLQSTNILKEIDRAKLFSNISDILEANVQFWKNSLYPLVRDMRAYKQPPCIETMCEGFLKMEDGFQAYYRFCGEQARCQHYCRENLTHNHIFTAYLAWCETQKECNRLRLMDILVQPMQRLTKYGLLLKAILRNTDDEVECDNLCLMIRSVDDFVNNVNSSLKQKQDNERLKGIIARIESYDIVETKDDDLEKLVKSNNQLDLNKPMLGCPPERKRHLLLEGDLKFKDSNTSKVEVHCFLLTDMLLVCKPTTKKGGATVRVVRQPYLVDKLVVTEINKETPTLACVYKNEFDMAVAAFTLQNTDSKKLKSWKHSIAKAQKLYSQAKQSFLPEESFDTESNFGFPCSFENEFHCLQAPRSPLASSSRASRVSSLAHSHSGSVEMNDQSSVGSAKEGSRAVSVENDNRTASISSDEGVQPLPPDKSPVSQKNSFKNRLFHKTPNTLSVQPYSHGLGQSLPNLVLGSPNMGTLSLNLPQNTLSVPSTSKNGHLLSPTHRGISYPPPSPTRGNLRRGLAITQSKNPPLIKTRHVTSASASTAGPMPASFDFDVPVIAGVSSADQCENFSRGQHRQAMLKRIYRNDNKRYHTAGVVDDIKKNNSKDASILKRLSWNCSSQEPQSKLEDQT